MAALFQVQYVTQQNQDPITLEFTEKDFQFAGQLGANESGSIIDLINDQYTPENIDSLSAYFEEYVQSLRAFRKLYGQEIKTLFQDVKKAIPFADRTPDDDNWMQRRYVPEGQKLDPPIEREVTFANYLFKNVVLPKLGLKLENDTVRRYNADGSDYHTLLEKLQACGMGYLYYCKKQDLERMFSQARSMLVKAHLRVLTPGMVMLKVWDQKYISEVKTNRKEKIPSKVLTLKRAQIRNGSASNAAYMSALFYAARVLADMEQEIEGKVYGGKVEQRKNLQADMNLSDGSRIFQLKDDLETSDPDKRANLKNWHQELKNKEKMKRRVTKLVRAAQAA